MARRRHHKPHDKHNDHDKDNKKKKRKDHDHDHDHDHDKGGGGGSESSVVAVPGNTGTVEDMAQVSPGAGPADQGANTDQSVYSTGAGDALHYHDNPSYIEQVAVATTPASTAAGSTAEAMHGPASPLAGP